jgi:DNA-binding NarL/FixJ family response regulator
MDSILSTGERRVAELLADGQSVAEIAEERGEPEVAVEKVIDRVREKTNRALATLLESPFAAAAAADLSEHDRERLIAVIETE